MREKDRRWEKRGGGNCGMNWERRSRSGKHVLCDAISMVPSRSASRAAHAPLLAPDDAPSSLTMVDRSVLEARLDDDRDEHLGDRRSLETRLAESHKGVFICVHV